ncbi:sugar transferase [Pontibacter sp. KCTC 32443]|uniref:sugar transferase n=1 Tax=Pontibacter TaxID=323449 RepID=UPI00164DAABA|nr:MULTISPECIES: sugar transferase [Pontibacter]MBC5773015.1 sugar transferase [Pontibacter sp. KCTC 32443]
MGTYSKIFKPLLDKMAGVAASVILFPVFAVVVLLQLLVCQSNPFFLQKRPGKGEKIFTLIKFKTMCKSKEIKGELLSDLERLTPLGAFLRATSLDELPQLINVVKGDMSFIGPRPLLVEYLHLYTEEQRKRHHVMPGITGWAQINGRDKISWEKKFELDLWYVENISFRTDIKILCKTVLEILRALIARKYEHVSVPKFSGTNTTSKGCFK